MIRPIVFTDLDDTLFQTERKCPEGGVAGLRPMSILSDGRTSGYATSRQQHILDWLRHGSVVPVTARSTSVLARVDIEQAPAVCSNGGCIITGNGTVDLEWHGRLSDLARSDRAVADVHADIAGGLDEDLFRHWIVSEGGLSLYVVIKSNQEDDSGLDGIASAAKVRLPVGWRIHRNGNNLALLPGWLNKRHAVSYLIEHIRSVAPDTPVIGIGDSASDAGFMDLCDFAMIPTNSQLWASVSDGNEWMR